MPCCDPHVTSWHITTGYVFYQARLDWYNIFTWYIWFGLLFIAPALLAGLYWTTLCLLWICVKKKLAKNLLIWHTVNRQVCSGWQWFSGWHTVLAERQWASFGCMLSHNQPFSDCHTVCITAYYANSLSVISQSFSLMSVKYTKPMVWETRTLSQTYFVD